uniref:Anaerobic DMSO reductase chain A n=1 Tax=uncultured bacterium Contig1491 TaxID=1393439 RepID=W0FJ58_9BACT|nr:anaerobic DMSO reductase chain A precursor [uncultured bacterium Contig1491]
MAHTDHLKLTRRSFVAASAAAAAALALTGCQAETQVAKTGAATSIKGVTVDPEFDPESGAEWIPIVCNANCGGFCENKVLVKDGVVLRQKTDDTTEDTWASPQLRSCPRGRSKQQDTFGVDRLKYPMKRKGWSADAPNGEKRGVDEWERISWDEAFQIVSEQVKKAIDQYGNRSILYAGTSTSFGQIANCINGLGGGLSSSSTESFGSCQYYSDPVIGTPLNGIGESNDRMDFVNADYIVLYGCNQAWASPGTYTYAFDEAKQGGTQFVYVGPEFNMTAAHFHAKWIRVRPGTDTALLLAVAYEMFKLDEAEGKGKVIDWDFLAKYTVGINGDAMPKDAKVKENFYDYLMGAYDDTPKNAEWASPITGTPVEDIRWYADMMRKSNNVMHLRSNAAFRCNDSDNLLQLYTTISLMGGHIGKSGNCADCAYHGTVGSPKNDPIFLAGDWAAGGTVYPNPIQSVVNDNELWPAVLEGKFNNTGNIVFGVLLPESQEKADIHVIVMDTVSSMNTKLDAMRAVEAMRKVDFVVTTARQFTVQAQYSDVVLPTVSEWEINGMRNQATWYANREALVIGRKVCEPMFEAKTDQQVGYGLAKAMGLPADEMYPTSEKQQWYNLLSTTTMRDEKTGEWGNMFSFTAEEIEALGAKGKPQDGFMPVSEILEKGVYKVERKAGDGYTYYGYQNFIKDPKANPLGTVSGKFEIYSQTKADMLNAAGRTKDFTWKPYPSYKVPVNGYEESFVDGDINGEKGEYPIQMFTPHYLRRSHTQFDNLPWLRHAFTNPVFIAAADADERGVKSGDWVRVYNQYGSILRPASVSQRFMPGVMAVPHGPWLDIDPKTGYDRAGCENVLTAPVGSGCGTAGYNTNLVNFEKYSGELPADYQLDPRVPAGIGE